MKNSSAQPESTTLKYGHILSAFSRAIWAILPDKFAVIHSFLRVKVAGGNVSAEQIATLKRPARRPYLLEIEETPLEASLGESGAKPEAASNSPRTKDGLTIAVLPLTGTISHRMGMLSEYSGGISTERFTQWLRAAAADPGVKAIVIDCDSPGGTVDGVPELAEEIARTNKSKPIVGVANSMAASAAYWLLSQCGELVITPSGEVGSVGVFASHEDVSKMYEDLGLKVSLISAGKYKTEGNPYEPLSDEARQALQNQVNDFYDLFTKAVSRGRTTDQKTVKAGFGEGRMLLAQQAVKEGMADRVATLDQTLAKLGAKSSSPKASSSATTTLASELFADHQESDDEMDEKHGPLPDDPDNDGDEDLCECKCEACRATPPNCEECSNDVCADPNCAHEPRAEEMPDVAAHKLVTLDWKAKHAARRRALNLV